MKQCESAKSHDFHMLHIIFIFLPNFGARDPSPGPKAAVGRARAGPLPPKSGPVYELPITRQAGWRAAHWQLPALLLEAACLAAGSQELVAGRFQLVDITILSS